MSKSARLRVADVRALVQLVGECRDLGDDPAAWQTHWLKQTGRLVKADLLFGGEIAIGPDGGLRPHCTTCWGWENGFDQEVWLAGMSEDNSELRFPPMMAGYFARIEPLDGDCLSRKDLVTDHEWQHSPYYQHLHCPLGIEHTLLCFVPIATGANEFFAGTASRELKARQDFSPRDRTLMREINRVLSSLVGGPLARYDAPSPATLAPRVRQVLECLLEGDGDKQIAARLKISRFTVNQYTKVIYRHFGATSRSELMARWIRRQRCV